MPAEKGNQKTFDRVPARHAILVLGMHRSGTSATARVANLLGATLPDQVLGPNDGNLKGYWEPQAVVDFNDRLLERLQHGWDDPVSSEELSDRLTPQDLDEAVDLLRSIYADAELIVVKDPRCTMVPEFWCEALSDAGYRVSIMYCVRPAGEVAQSLDRRDEMSADTAALLWCQYNVNAMRVLKERPYSIVSYSDLKQNWRAAFNAVADAGGFRWQASEAAFEQVDQFLGDPRDSSEVTFSTEIRTLVDDVRFEIETAAAAVPSTGRLDDLDASIHSIAKNIVREHVRYRRELVSLRGQAAQLVVDNGNAQNVINDLEALLTDARRAQEDAEQRAARAQTVIDSAEEELASSRNALNDADIRAVEAQSVIQSLETELDGVRAAMGEADVRAAEARTVISDLERHLEKARGDFDAAQARQEELRARVERAETRGEELLVRAETAERDLAGTLSSIEDLYTQRQMASDAHLDAMGQLSVLIEDFNHLEAGFQALEQSVHEYRAHADRLETELRHTQADYASADAERVALRIELENTSQRLHAIESSTFWRATAPARAVFSRMPAVSRFLRRVAKLGWWTVTLQLPARLAARKAALAVADPIGSVDQVTAEPGNGLPPLDQLKPVLATQFDAATAEATAALIERYELPFQQEGMQAIKREIGDAQAREWARELVGIRSKPDRKPDVSIVVPAYNQIAFTLACIESVLRLDTDLEFEILVGDDRSSDGTQAAAAVDIPRVTWVRHETNLGFVLNCNETAKAASGRIIVMLNNDTLVLPGWLDGLVAELDADPRVGLAGSKLIYPDGRLQEAGGIFWQDGSAWNFGRFNDPRRPEFSYARDVDYISGASIALRREVWEEMGGFDELYVPAYAEDADLAFRLRAAGYRTRYQPASQLLHFEGVSSGTDTGSGIKAYQVTNLERLKERWSETLASHRPNAVEPELEKERNVSKRALFLDLTTPEPQHDAGSVVAVECMRALQKNGFKVTFVPQDNFLWTREFSAPLQRQGIETIHHPYYSRQRPFLDDRGGEFDLIFVHRYQTAERTLADLRACAPQARIVLLNADLHYLREMREAELVGDADRIAAAEETRRRELQVMRAVDLVLTHSTVERDLLAEELGEDHVMVLPLIHDPAPTPSTFEQRSGIGFIGGYGHPPNVDAVDWFVDEIWSRVREKLPDAEFVLAGSKMPKRFKKLDGKNGVRVLGFVESLDDYFDGIRLSVVPLRFGAGAKGKVAASLAAGVPGVSTEIGIEGMDLQRDHHIGHAETADEFVDRLVALYGDETAWATMRARGLDFAETVTSRAAVEERIREMIERVGVNGRRLRKAS